MKERKGQKKKGRRGKKKRREKADKKPWAEGEIEREREAISGTGCAGAGSARDRWRDWFGLTLFPCSAARAVCCCVCWRHS